MNNTEEEQLPQLQFSEFIKQFDETRELIRATTVGKITSIVIKEAFQCLLIIADPLGISTTAFEMVVYGSEFHINDANKDEYKGQYIVLSYNAYKQIEFHYFSKNRAELIYEDPTQKIPKTFTQPVISSVTEDNIGLKYKQRKGRYVYRPLKRIRCFLRLFVRMFHRKHRHDDQPLELNIIK